LGAFSSLAALGAEEVDSANAYRMVKGFNTENPHAAE
jgi:hypothetical protein